MPKSTIEHDYNRCLEKCKMSEEEEKKMTDHLRSKKLSVDRARTDVITVMMMNKYLFLNKTNWNKQDYNDCLREVGRFMLLQMYIESLIR